MTVFWEKPLATEHMCKMKKDLYEDFFTWDIYEVSEFSFVVSSKKEDLKFNFFIEEDLEPPYCVFYEQDRGNLKFIIKNIDKFKHDRAYFPVDNTVCIKYSDLLLLLGK